MASRSDKKQRKEATKDRRQLEKNLERQRRDRAVLNRVLAALGLTDIFAQLPKSVRDQAIGWRNPKPQVIIEADSPSHPDLLEAKTQLEQMFSVWTVSLKNGGSLTLNEYFTYGVGISPARMIVTTPTEKDRIDRILAQIRSVIQPLFFDDLDNSVGTLIRQVEMLLERYSRIDDKFIGAAITLPKNQSGRNYVHIALRLYPAEEKRVAVDGKSRRAYRCGAATEDTLEWVSWKSDAVGLEGPARKVPVYLQDHALQRLRERVTIEQANGWVDDFVWQSLKSPAFAKGRDGSILVEYRFFNYKLGYFVVEFVDDLAIITTFLFLTMNGTPEGDKLYDLLRVTRSDKTYLGLDQLNTFCISDLKNDSELLAAFEQCGCGHLLRMTKEDYISDDMQGRGAEVKKYLGNRLGRLLKSKPQFTS